MKREDGAEDIESVETGLFVEAMYRHYGTDFRGFQRASLAARLAAFAAAHGMADISTLQGRMLRDAGLARAAARALGTADTGFFTDPTNLTALRLSILPILRSSSWPAIWLAETSDTRLLLQLVDMLEQEDLLRRTEIFVTTGDDTLLGAAAGLPESLSHNIVISQYNLSTDASFKEFHAIVCQRPLIEFDPDLRKRCVALFAQSLCNFGILQVEAGAGMLSGEAGDSFIPVLSEQGIYRRLASADRGR